MGSLPVQAPAVRAAPDLVLVPAHGVGEEMFHRGLLYRLDSGVADRAATERADRRLEVEPGDHLQQLGPRLGRTDEVAVGELAVLEELHVPGGEEPPLGP